MESRIAPTFSDTRRDLLWYQDPTKIVHHFCGVFEGGGVKGVAYAGALLAMRTRQCWFTAVAGSSAGAITAALIAAGLEPEEVAAKTEEAIKTVRAGFWSGLVNLRTRGGFYDSDELRDWLDDVFRNRVGLRLGKSPDAPVTFKELFQKTGIELNIVAADISMRRQLVLSHWNASECLVADAVCASCSIPFAFPSHILAVPEPGSNGQAFHHTIVDGGVWANFPIFIFEDTEFRRFDNRPDTVDQAKVLGFLLKPTNDRTDEAHARVEALDFVRHVSNADFRAREWFADAASTPGTSQGFWPRVASFILMPIELLGRMHDFGRRGLDSGRWPLPRTAWGRRLLNALDGFLTAIGVPGGGILPLLIPIAVTFILLVGAWNVCTYITTDAFTDLQSLNWRDGDTYINLLFRGLLTVMVYSAAALTVIVGVCGIMTTFLLLRPARRILYGLVTTYVAGPGAPLWYYKKKNVVVLPIPPELTTLRFDLPETVRQQTIEAAREKTLERLQDILAEEVTVRA